MSEGELIEDGAIVVTATRSWAAEVLPFAEVCLGDFGRFTNCLLIVVETDREEMQEGSFLNLRVFGSDIKSGSTTITSSFYYYKDSEHYHVLPN